MQKAVAAVLVLQKHLIVVGLPKGRIGYEEAVARAEGKAQRCGVVGKDVEVQLNKAIASCGCTEDQVVGTGLVKEAVAYLEAVALAEVFVEYRQGRRRFYNNLHTRRTDVSAERRCRAIEHSQQSIYGQTGRNHIEAVFFAEAISEHTDVVGSGAIGGEVGYAVEFYDNAGGITDEVLIAVLQGIGLLPEIDGRDVEQKSGIALADVEVGIGRQAAGIGLTT